LSGAPGSETNPVVVNSEPGKGFRYSGGGSLVAQLALMDVTKKDFTTLTQEMIFVPLGMKNATFAQPLPGKFAAQASWGYSAASWYKGMPYVYPQQAAAGLYTTASDLAKFFIDIQQSYQGKGKTLSAAMTKQMFTPQAVFSKGENTVEHIGLGPFLLQRPTNKDNKGVYFYFDGTNAGFTAFARASVEGGNGVVVLLNSGDDFNGLGKEIIRAVAQTYNWHNFLPETVKPIALDAKELDKYAGRYRKGPNEVVYVRREKGYLVSKINDGEDVYCFPVAKDTIVLTDFNLKSYFGRDAAGNVVSLRSVYQDKPMPKMAANELTLSELMKAGRYAEAKTELKKMNLDASQLTYLAYETFGKKPLRLEAVKAILEVAVEQHPNEAIVHNRWGDLYAFLNDAENATKSFQKAAALDPSDAYAKEMLRKLGK
nr:beta-lactamase family protein [Cytophagales bacterium]